MKQKEITALSLALVAHFFDGNFEPLIDHFASGILWIGPRDNQIIRGKEELASHLHRARTNAEYTLSDISTQTASVGKKGMNQLLLYDVLIRTADGREVVSRQRTLFAWELQKLPRRPASEAVPRIAMILVSNAALLFGSGQAAENAPERTWVTDSSSDTFSSKRILVRGAKDESHYLDVGRVLYIESTDSSHHSLIHTTSGDLPCLDKVTALAEQYGGTFLRCHASYLVNPYYIRSLKRFSLTLADGTVLPVPEKKYTAFKKALNAWALEQHT